MLSGSGAPPLRSAPSFSGLSLSPSLRALPQSPSSLPPSLGDQQEDGGGWCRSRTRLHSPQKEGLPHDLDLRAHLHQMSMSFPPSASYLSCWGHVHANLNRLFSFLGVYDMGR
ncbi:hypothetical protein BDA96_10G341800 [Sorghum bicolor]|uniref:Uncharacterized protein n=2 Tax=Sorghum bicolor TaxID=4558 RepID=A0A194YLQ2_SORBI|nr:hypothetical protein BDA96_10G341800 [Sorghum bicolor]KXG20877.1 hypothetical protein SORBI_3010G264700 [Sorghum bicolor]OQU77110.1 hypothetical protein SORBI_3010G264700 [Sorghum bicolor]